MPKTVQPGDLSALLPERLGATRQYVALAALIRGHQQQLPTHAIQALFAASRDEEAFRWVWALLREAGADALWPHTVSLADGIEVPGDLAGEVSQFVLAPGPSLGADRPVPPAVTARELLLRKLAPASKVAHSIAKAAIAPDASPTPGVREAALNILGASKSPAERNLVFEHTKGIPPEKRPAALLRLEPSYRGDETALIVEALTEVTRRPLGDPDWTPAATLASRLPTKELGPFLAQQWRRPDNKRRLLGAGLLPQLGLAKLRSLLEEKLGDEVTALVLEHVATQFPANGSLVEFGVWAHEQYPAVWLKPLREKYAQAVASAARHGYERREPPLGALLAFTFASDRIEPAAVLAQFIEPGDRLIPDGMHLDGVKARRLGQLVGCLLAHTPEGLEDTIREMAVAVPPELLQHFFSGIAASEAPAKSAMPARLMQILLSDANAIAEFAKAGYGDVLVGAVEGTAPTARDVVLAAADHLGLAQIQTLLKQIDWVRVGGDSYEQVVSQIGNYPAALFGEVDRAVASLSDPESHGMPAPLLYRLLKVALEAGLRDQLSEAATSHVATLLGHRDPGIVTAACAWVRRLDIEGSDVNTQRVERVVAADNARAGRNEALRDVRAELGTKLAELAQDTDLPTGERCRYLSFAATAAPSAGRAAAFKLAQSPINDLRDVAADVLIGTPASVDDHDELQQLAATESQAPVQAKLQAALHHVRSGSIGEALRNLAEMFGLPSHLVEPTVLVPDARFHDRLQEWIDKARSRATNAADPGPFMEAANNLADMMVDIAVVERHAVDPSFKLRPAEVEGIRTNSSPRPNSGTLLGRQDLQGQFSWFPTCLALRTRRTAHPAPLGQVQPLKLTSYDLITARNLLGDICRGWVASMWVTRNCRVGN